MIGDTAAVLFYFTLYSHMGWLLENSYNFLTTREFYKPNFFWGPFKPMYGIAPLLLVYFVAQTTNWIAVIFLCFTIPTSVEYVSGVLLHKFFHRRWWDYSDYPLQLQGHICLYFSIAWIFLSLLFLQWIHPAMVSIYEVVVPYWTIAYPAVFLYFIAELFFAIRIHLPKVSPLGDQQI